MKNPPLLSWDIYSEFYFRHLKQIERKTEIEKLTFLAEKFQWKNNISHLINRNDYEAIIVTDINRKIIWVNNGFTEMTGYSKGFALNRTPVFLQGKETSSNTKERIRNKIKLNKPFKEVITNYKKDNTPYKCEIQVIPMYNKITTHFMALEKQVS